MPENLKIKSALARLTLKNRENAFSHHSYNEDMRQYEYVKRGDLQAVSECFKLFEGPTTGTLSQNPVRNYQYLFVASVTLACRYCIEGGMDSETAFNLSDLYIQQVDKLSRVEDIFQLRREMMRDYTARMHELHRERTYARPVLLALDRIEEQLHEPLTLERLAKELSLSPAYLSTLFKKEVGVPLSAYIRQKRIDTAKLLLQYTECSCLEIAEYLCFSSESHFSRVFRKIVGQTPRAYRNLTFHIHLGNPE